MEKIDYINWWEKNYEKDLEELKANFINLFSETDFLPSIYHPILYKYLKNTEMKHWNKDIFVFSKNKIREIEKIIGTESMTLTLLSNIHSLIYTYQNLLDLEERIIVMDRFKGSEELKAKFFGINIYNDLLNLGFSNILKVFIEFQSLIEGKNLYQSTLRPQIDCLASQKRGYGKITELADSNIRNAISHGGVKTVGSNIIFSYSEGTGERKKHYQKELTVYEFKDSMFQLYDGISAILLAWIEYLCEKNISYKEIYDNKIVNEDTSIFYEKLSLSTLLITCDRVFQLEINNEGVKRQQVNVEFSSIDMDINSRIFFGLHTAERIFNLRKLSHEDSITVSFRTPKTIKSFFIVNCSVISDLSDGIIDIQEAIRIILEGKSILMFPINDEDRNKFEDDFRYYPDIETEEFYIKEIEDISIEKQKGFKAIVYLKKAKRKSHVQEAVNSVIKKIESLENYGFSSHSVKYGKMDSDIIYLVLYKQEVRRRQDRTLLPNNDNFIAQVQYDINKKFPIQNKLLDKYLKKRRIGFTEYNWNPNF